MQLRSDLPRPIAVLQVRGVPPVSQSSGWDSSAPTRDGTGGLLRRLTSGCTRQDWELVGDL